MEIYPIISILGLLAVIIYLLIKLKFEAKELKEITKANYAFLHKIDNKTDDILNIKVKNE